MRGCFTYLVNHTERAVEDGVRSLSLLHANYLDRFPTPVILFHEDELTDAMKLKLASAVDNRVVFVPVRFLPYSKSVTGSWGPGYLNMCRFFTTEVFRHPVLTDADYICRLDTDSFILAPIEYNLFETGAWYGFLNDTVRAGANYCEGLTDTLKTFISQHPGAKVLNPVEEERLYYTNFEVCYLPWFRGQLWREFAEFMSPGIQTHRWGDHVIRYAGVKTFMPPEKVQWYEGIQYSHQGIGASHVA